MPSDSPFVGPRPFQENESDLFFGRDAEGQELASRIVSHSEVLVYAQSGAGKSSLINARVKPLLSSEYEVLTGARLQGPALDVDTERIRNIYAFHVMSQMIGKSISTMDPAQATFKDYFAVQPRRKSESGADLPRILVLDQMEELFTFYPERWRDRRDFFEQLRDALRADDLFHILISMREDHIAEVDPYAMILPEKLRTRFRLERLRRETALLSVIGPVKNTGVCFQDGVASYLVGDLLKVRARGPDGKLKEVLGEFVEPVQLQVVCQTLWNSLQPGDQEISYDMVRAVGDVDRVLQKFYEQALASAMEASDVKEPNLREFFENVLITPAGTRGTVYRGDTNSGGVPNASINILENVHHIIRAEQRGGAKWYELTHDRLIQPIRKSGQEWLLRGKQHSLEERAKLWADTHSGTSLLTEAELVETIEWLETTEAIKLGISRKVDDFVEASRTALEFQDKTLRLAWERFESYDYGAISAQSLYSRLRALLIFVIVVGTALAIATKEVKLVSGYLHWAILLITLCIVVLQIYSNRFRDDTKWKTLRFAAEKLRAEIFRYRTRTGDYSDARLQDRSRSATLAARIETITQGVPAPTISAPAFQTDQRLKLLNGPEYLEERLKDQISYYGAKSRRLNRQLRANQFFTITMGAASVLLVAIGLDFFISFTFIIFLALTLIQEMDQTESSLAEFSRSHKTLMAIQDWWEALPLSDRMQHDDLELLVNATETTLEGELISWNQQTESVMDLLQQRRGQLPPSSKSIV